jgi:hypothetical protein
MSLLLLLLLLFIWVTLIGALVNVKNSQVVNNYLDINLTRGAFTDNGYLKIRLS